jgi:hypothetical protein
VTQCQLPASQAAISAAPTKENVMRLITIFELATLKNSELQALFRQASAELVRTDDGSADRRNTLATLDNITNVMRSRDSRQP